ncbi:MAG TPA: hypothetical protein VND91_09150 [Candidatus Saccharimonadia bacterium]|nr:hypothetical protein [Candidatus Saccharimonadia bacterium]
MQNTMRVTMLLAAVCALAACKKEGDAAPATDPAAPAPVAVVAVPTTTDHSAWKPYLTSLVKKHMDRRYKRPYMYFIPAAGGDEEQRQYDAQLESAQAAVARGILAGTMLAFGGPDPGRTAQAMVDSIRFAGPGSLKGVRVVYIGSADQDARVREVVTPTAAEYIFEDMGPLPTYAVPDQAASAPGSQTTPEGETPAPDAPVSETPVEGEEPPAQ